MNLRRKQFSVVLSVVGLLTFAGLWLVRQTEPKYHGKTAQEWIYSIARGETEGGFLPEMIGQMPHQFMPTLIDSLEKIDSPTHRLHLKWYSLAPETIRDVFPRPLDPFKLMNIANTGADEILSKHPHLRPELEKQLPRLRRLVKSPNEDIFGAATDLICSILAGEAYPYPQPEKYLKHPELLVRIAASLLFYNNAKASNNVELISVLVDATTNQVAVNELFGERAVELRQSISKCLNQISPETAAKYSGNLK